MHPIRPNLPWMTVVVVLVILSLSHDSIYLMILVVPLASFPVKKVKRKERRSIGGNPLHSFNQEIYLFVAGEIAQVQTHKTYREKDRGTDKGAGEEECTRKVI